MTAKHPSGCRCLICTRKPHPSYCACAACKPDGAAPANKPLKGSAALGTAAAPAMPPVAAPGAGVEREVFDRLAERARHMETESEQWQKRATELDELLGAQDADLAELRRDLVVTRKALGQARGQAGLWKALARRLRGRSRRPAEPDQALVLEGPLAEVAEVRRANIRAAKDQAIEGARAGVPISELFEPFMDKVVPGWKGEGPPEGETEPSPPLPEAAPVAAPPRRRRARVRRGTPVAALVEQDGAGVAASVGPQAEPPVEPEAEQDQPPPGLTRTPEPLPGVRPALPVRTEPVRLTVIAVSEVSGPGDIFACDKLHAKLKAGDCRDRQGKAQAATTDRPSTRTLEIRKQASAHAACRACPVGRQIVEQLGRTTPGKAA